MLLVKLQLVDKIQEITYNSHFITLNVKLLVQITDQKHLDAYSNIHHNLLWKKNIEIKVAHSPTPRTY